MNKKLKVMRIKNAIDTTHFDFPGQKDLYHGKVRDVYNIDDKMLVMVTTDRISAFDVVLPKPVPFKGQVLNQIAETFLNATEDIVPNWKIACPDPMVTVGRRCAPYPVEMIVRAYLSGSAWRTYQSGAREICGVPIPDGMREHQQLPEPVITPTTKADTGHDMDISREEILKQGIVLEEEYEQMEEYALKLFRKGSEMANDKGLILVDTKYEFGKAAGQIFLIDEVHTPDSSRYFYLDEYAERFRKGEKQKQLSKEFVREWLMAKGFSGKEGQKMPEMDQEFVNSVSERYIELYEKITGLPFQKAEGDNTMLRVEQNISDFLRAYRR